MGDCSEKNSPLISIDLIDGKTQCPGSHSSTASPVICLFLGPGTFFRIYVFQCLGLWHLASHFYLTTFPLKELFPERAGDCNTASLVHNLLLVQRANCKPDFPPHPHPPLTCLHSFIPASQVPDHPLLSVGAACVFRVVGHVVPQDIQRQSVPGRELCDRRDIGVPQDSC